MAGPAGLGGKPRGKREVIDVPEPKPEDKSLDRLLNVRKQRMDRLERERRESREAWKAKRVDLHDAVQRCRAARQATQDYWQQARAEFLNMVTTSGQYQKTKAIYARMKDAAAQCYLECQEEAAHCRAARDAFFEARRCVIHANKQQEKLGILRDEIRRLNQPVEA
jgi:hypothetical protein